MRSRHPVSALAAPARGLSFAVYSKEQVYLGHLAVGGREVGLWAPGTRAPSDPIPAGGLRPARGSGLPNKGRDGRGKRRVPPPPRPLGRSHPPPPPAPARCGVPGYLLVISPRLPASVAIVVSVVTRAGTHTHTHPRAASHVELGRADPPRRAKKGGQGVCVGGRGPAAQVNLGWRRVGRGALREAWKLWSRAVSLGPGSAATSPCDLGHVIAL